MNSFLLVACLSVLFTGVLSASPVTTYPKNFEEAKSVIHDHLDKYYHPLKEGSLCASNSCCNVTASNTCAISSFPKDKSTLVLPGGQTRCIFSYSTPFAFQVRLINLRIFYLFLFDRSFQVIVIIFFFIFKEEVS
jgi:hypothetical protein